VGVGGVIALIPLEPVAGRGAPPGAGVGVFVALPGEPRNPADSGGRKREAGGSSSPEAAEGPRLDLAIEIFDHDLDDPARNDGDTELPPDLIPAEARFVSTELRRTLEGTDSWGAVRVVPVAGDGFGVVVSGTMLRSGSNLALKIEARDALGRRRGPEIYRETETTSRRALYGRIASDLLVWRHATGPGSLEAIRQAALLRFGARLAPETFARYLEPQESPTGLARPPDLEDLLKRRLTSVWERDRAYLTILNDHYLALLESMAGPYEEWRAEASGSPGAVGPLATLEGLWRSFEAAGPSSFVELEGQSRQLEGSVEDQFLSWRSLARRVLRKDTDSTLLH
jgi:hypothetical protein